MAKHKFAMKGGTLPKSETLGRVYGVTVYPNDAEVWFEGNLLRKVVYNTGDIVWFLWDTTMGGERAYRVETYDGQVWM